MRNSTGLVLLVVAFVVAVGLSLSRGQVDPTHVDHVQIAEVEPIDPVTPLEPVVAHQTISVPVTVGSDGAVVRRVPITVRRDATVVRHITTTAGVSQEIRQLESVSRKIAKDLQELPEDELEERQDLEKQLREKLDDEFQARMRIEQDKVKELRDRLQNVEGRLAKREENRQLIIDRRFAELTGDATLAWDTYSDNRGPNTRFFQFQTPEGTSWATVVPAPASTGRFRSTIRPGHPEASESQQPRRRSWTRGRLFSNPLGQRSEIRQKRNAEAEAEEKEPSDVAALQQKAVELQMEIQNRIESLRESTSRGKADQAKDELDAALELLRELKDRLDSLNSREDPAPTVEYQ